MDRPNVVRNKIFYQQYPTLNKRAMVEEPIKPAFQLNYYCKMLIIFVLSSNIGNNVIGEQSDHIITQKVKTKGRIKNT